MKPRSRAKMVCICSYLLWNGILKIRAAKEIEALRREAQAFKAVRKLIRTPEQTDAARQAFDKVNFFSSLIQLYLTG